METEAAQIKHSGADWLIGRGMVLSPLGVKVANILGQVYRGIYHLRTSEIDRVMWNTVNPMTVVIFKSMATFDGDELTLLYLCCRAAKVHFVIHGRCRHYLAITFWTPTDDAIKNWSDFAADNNMLPDQPLSVDEFIESRQAFKPGHKTRWQNERSRFVRDFQVGQVQLSVPNNHLDIDQMVVDAHQACIRVELSGLSHQSMLVTFSKRHGREGAFWERHPAWGKFKSFINKLYSIDFSEVT